jgi:hypothetical protein
MWSLMASETPIHSKLLTAVGRNFLRPMGLFQKGRSRTWLDDHGWWVCVVEFQPSRWSRGSYLNVGCMWLWCEKDYISFDQGSRIESFSGFQDQDQFELEASRLAKRAAEEVQRYRLLFPNVHSVCEFYLGQPVMPPGHWQHFHAGVACAMAGKLSDAVRFFDHFLAADGNRPEWLIAAQTDAKRLKALTADTIEFREVITNRVRRARELQKLPTATLVDFDDPIIRGEN